MAATILQQADEWDVDDEHHHIRSVTGIDLDDLEYEQYGVDDDDEDEDGDSDRYQRGRRHKNGLSTQSTISPETPYHDDWDDIDVDIESTPTPNMRKHTRGAQSAINIGDEYSRPKKFKPKPRKLKSSRCDAKSSSLKRNDGSKRNRNRAQSVIDRSARSASSSRSGSYTLSHVHTASMHRATVSSNRALRRIGNT